MRWRTRHREHSDQPLGGFKLAHPMLSADGTRIGFSGVTVGRGHVYRVIDDAVCVQGGKHACPSRWCDCGFYCFHDMRAAQDLACDPEHRDAVLLQVAASGRYRRYERGLRYSRQRVTAVRIGRCRCGRPATGFADSGSGSVGWRRLVPSCVVCVGTRPRVDVAAFGALAGAGVTVASTAPPGEPEDPVGLVAVLSAEMSLMQARLDDMQARLERLTGRDRPSS